MSTTSSNNEKWKQEIANSLQLSTENTWTEEERNMVEEAMTGLGEINDEAIISNTVNAINTNLQAQINKRKKKKTSRRVDKEQKNIWIYTIVFLMLVLIAWLVIAQIK